MTLLLPFSQEATEVHTRILRLSLGAEESRVYWARVDPRVPLSERAAVAEAQGWFPGKSGARVRYLLAAFAERYDAFPDGLEALRRWRAIDATSARVVAHVHLMLSDPLHRAFTGELLVERRREGRSIDRDEAQAWIEARTPGRWAGITARQAAQKLLAAATEAGVLSATGEAPPPRSEEGEAQDGHAPPKRGARVPLVAPVPDLALAYILYLLRGVRFAGSGLGNPYLSSLGLEAGALPERLLTMGAFGIRLRDGGVVAFSDPDVLAWSRHTFAPIVG